MKATAIVLLLASSAFAADQAAVAAAESACRPVNIKFDAKADTSQHPAAQAQDGKALVHVVEAFERPGNQLARPTTKVGLDGVWVGANKNNSYFFFSVEPGASFMKRLAIDPQRVFKESRVDQFFRRNWESLLLQSTNH